MSIILSTVEPPKTAKKTLKPLGGLTTQICVFLTTV